MTDDLFTTLSMKLLAGEASNDDRKALEHLLEKDPALRADFEELKTTLLLLKVHEPLRQASSSIEPKLPPYRMQELRTAVRKEFSAPLETREGSLWWKLLWRQALPYASCALAVLLVGAVLLNHRSGIEFGAYQDSGMRDGLESPNVDGAVVQAFASDEGFQIWQKSRFGPQYRIWFDEGADKIVVVESGGLFSANTSSVYPLPEKNEDRARVLKDILAGLKKQD